MKYCLLIISITTVLFGGCAKSSETGQEASVNLESSTAAVQSNSLENQTNSSDSLPTFVAEKATSMTRGDVTVMKDGYGNTVESRFFGDHPRIISVVVRTTANGEKKAIVYGHNGDRRPLPEYKIADALTDDANRLADVAGIWKGVEESTTLPPLKTVVSEPLPPVVTEPKETGNQISDSPNDNSPNADQNSPKQTETKNDSTSPNPKEPNK